MQIDSAVIFMRIGVKSHVTFSFVGSEETFSLALWIVGKPLSPIAKGKVINKYQAIAPDAKRRACELSVIREITKQN
jgi:hypothetical protein